MSTTVIRIPTDVHEQTTRIAALCGEQPGALLARAWREYLANHREDFAQDLDQAAQLMRSAPVEDLVAFAQDTHHVTVEESALLEALDDPRLQQFLTKAAESGERRARQGRDL